MRSTTPTAKVHRDIKPANIFVTARSVKLLDFGLARSALNSPSGLSQGETRIQPITEVGTTIGIVAYMSPEQLRGEPLDHRTDVFSLGLVLYEMATGTPAFGGSTAAVVASAILERPAPSPRLARPELPTAFEALIGKTFEKDRELRCQAAAEIRADLKRLHRQLQESGSASQVTVSPGVVPEVGAGKSLRRYRPFMIATAALLALLTIAAVWVLNDRASSPQTSGFSLDDAEIVPLTTSGRAERPAISPDGKYVVYVERDEMEFSLWLRQPGTTSAVRIIRPERGVRIWAATVTPEGSFIDYVRSRVPGGSRELWRVPLLGGTARRLLADVHSPISWSPDAQRFAYVRTDAQGHVLLPLDRDGRNERVVTKAAEAVNSCP
jgi:serine/threonine protein kinase